MYDIRLYDWKNAKIICDETNNPPEVLEEKKIIIDLIVPKKSSIDSIRIPLHDLIKNYYNGKNDERAIK